MRLRDELYADDPANKPLIMVDNTFLGPVFQQPIRHGADVSLYSLTKYVGGHSDLVAGGVVGNKAALLPIMALRNTIGTITDPHTSWMLLRSLETVALRMERAESERAQGVRIPARTSEDRARRLSRLPRSRESARRIYASHCSGAGSTFSVSSKAASRRRSGCSTRCNS